jgi:hypothetical protein
MSVRKLNANMAAPRRVSCEFCTSEPYSQIILQLTPCREDSSDAARQFCSTGEPVKLQEKRMRLKRRMSTAELAASHELGYHLTKRRRSIYMLCSGYAKVNPTGIESIDHLRPRRRPPFRHPL